MSNKTYQAVTGVTGYTGKYIAKRLIASGKNVKSLTGHPGRVSPVENVLQFPFNFDNPQQLIRDLHDVDVLYNTYWVRFPYRRVSFEIAVENSNILIQAAKSAGVRRLVHISVTNPTEESPLAYYRGKAEVEKLLKESGISYAIVRPTVIFGKEDILINNIAWLLRNFPFFTIPGNGNYRLQPVFVDDVAKICIDVAQQSENIIIDAAGPDIFTYEELVYLIAEKIQRKTKIIHTPAVLTLFLSYLFGFIVRDKILTKEELAALMTELLISNTAPRGQTSFEKWLEQNNVLGTQYHSELNRHFQNPVPLE